MNGYVDMHCHILPGVDDGAQNTDEMRAMLRMAYADGTRTIIATPHCHPGRGRSSPLTLRKKMDTLREAASSVGRDLKVLPGTEIYYESDTAKGLKNGVILTLNGTKYVLVEFSPTHTFGYIRQGLQEIQAAGYDVILAHVERYPAVASDISNAENLCEMGILLQVNAGSITGEGGRTRKKAVKELMDEDLVFCVGSDAHGTKERPPKLRKAAEYVQKRYGRGYCEMLFSDNIKEALGEVDRK